MQCSHQNFGLGSPRAPLLRNRDPVRILGGQSYSQSAIDVEKILPDYSAFHFINAHSKGTSGGPLAEITKAV